MTSSRMFRLTNTLQGYAWGSATAIQELLGLPVDGAPVGEMWLGAHALGPSIGTPEPAAGPDGAAARAIDLPTLLRAEPDRLLGRAVVEEFGPRLPYLLKVLAAERPLSLQVHPRPHVARAGFSRENAAGLPLDAPERNYKDDQHKPEMLLALTPFEGLCGFRRPERILDHLDGLPGRGVERMCAALRESPDARGVRRAFEIALGPRDALDLDLAIGALRDRVDSGRSASRGDRSAVELAERFPGDPGALVSLMLNRVSLRPGDAVFLDAGEVHAYLSGLGVEIMASSDNVLRAAFTAKRVDVEALLACASYQPRPPEHPILRAEAGGLTACRAPVPEFALLYGTVAGRGRVDRTGPRILLCLDGSLELSTAQGPLGTVARGESVFLSHDAGPVGLDGHGTVVVAYVP